MHKVYQFHRKRFVNWEQWDCVLLDGHPTKAQIESEKGKRGNPTSVHNVWCDEQCGKQARMYLESLENVNA